MQSSRAAAVHELPSDALEAIALDIAIVTAIKGIPTLLEVLCDTTGMGFAAVARVTENTWTACAVRDRINFGLEAGGQLDVESTLCIESKRSLEPVVIDCASADPRYANHHTPRRYNIESYISVPIVLGNGRYFGNLCAIDPAAARVSDPKVVSMFKKFATLIAMHLETEYSNEILVSALQAERTTSELREQFIAILGHDLRNPLQAIFAVGELLERKAADPTLKTLAARVRTSAKRMSSLIDDVLDFARARLGGGIGVQIDHVDDMASGLNAVVKELQDGHPERQIASSIHVGSAVNCDLGRVQQVLSNLIGNALAHGAATSPVNVHVATDQSDLVMEVWNAGNPIPTDSIDKIFEPFWRHSTSANRQGLGLGLHICAQIVHAHQGTLAVTSTLEDGTRFTARLPLQASLNP